MGCCYRIPPLGAHRTLQRKTGGRVYEPEWVEDTKEDRASKSAWAKQTWTQRQAACIWPTQVNCNSRCPTAERKRGHVPLSLTQKQSPIDNHFPQWVAPGKQTPLKAGCVPSSRSPTENELSSLSGSSSAHVMSELFPVFCLFEFYPIIFHFYFICIFFFSLFTLQVLFIHMMASSLVFLWDSWLSKWLCLYFLYLLLRSFPSVFFFYLILMC